MFVSASNESAYLDHSSSLVRRELVLISLIWLDSAQLHREESIASGLDERKPPELESNIVLLDEVVIDCGRNFGDIITVANLQGKLEVLCVKTL